MSLEENLLFWSKKVFYWITRDLKIFFKLFLRRKSSLEVEFVTLSVIEALESVHDTQNLLSLKPTLPEMTNQ